MSSLTKSAAYAVRVAAIAGVLMLLGVMLAPVARAAHVNSTATLAATQTGDPDGTGNIDLTFNSSTGEVCYNLTVANIDAPTAAHIHAGEAGSAGGVVVNFGDPIVLGALTCVMSTPTQVQAITADPMSFYVNVHNAAFPAGAIRAQVGALTAGTAQSSTTTLMPTGDPAGSGNITITFDVSVPQVCYTLTATGLSSVITAAHIHTGGPGVDGGVLINLDYVAGQAEPKCLTTGTTPSVTAANINTVLADPGGHYVNVHTSGAPSGAIRGQVAATSATTSTTSFGLDGLGFGDPDGSGSVALTLYPDGTVCYTLTVADIDAPSAAHIHTGADGVQGPVLVDFDLSSNGLMACVQSTATAVEALIADPAGHYVNVHNSAFPAGAIRGQLSSTSDAPATTSLDLGLTPTGDPDGAGKATFNIDPATGRICYTLAPTNIDNVTAAHIHIGPAGVDGDVRVNLDIPMNGLAGCVFASAADAMAIVGDLAGHYVNVHTAVHPAGAVRAQLNDAPAPISTATPTPAPTVTQPVGPGTITNAPVDPAATAPTPAATPPSAASPAPAPAQTSGGLAYTGTETTLASVALLMMGMGFVASGVSKRRVRRNSQD